jgi:hypothetical protein
VAERFSCARTSAELHEPLLGTASRVRRWVLVEQPGSWGADALLESRLPLHLAHELRRRCDEVRARPLLIRRTDGRRTGTRRVFVVSSRPGAAWAERIDLDDVEELEGLDLAPLGADESVGGHRLERSLLLTCTNGRHDACCAEYGRGVATALEASHGQRAWECSHIGGDRFAANVLCLPEGVYYGRLTPESAAGVARLHDAGQLSLPHYRGRSTLAFDEQAAETMLRFHLGADGIADVGLVRRQSLSEEVLAVDFDAGGQRWRVELEVMPDPQEQRMTCAEGRLGCPPRYTEREIRRLPDDGAPGRAGSG